MLTQEQARGLNIQQHELEDAELQQAKAQQNVDKYYDAIQKASEAAKNGTPEQKEKIAWLLPQLVQWYNDAKNKRAYEEDRYRQALNKINEYKDLDAAQQPVQWGWQRRRVITPPSPEPTIETPTPQVVSNTNYVPSGTFNDAANGYIEWMWEWVYDNVGRPMWKFFNRWANNLWLISDADKAWNLKIMDEAMDAQLHSDNNVNRDSKAYIYANEGTKAFGDFTKGVDTVALLKPNIRTVPYNGPYELGYRGVTQGQLWLPYKTPSLPYNMPAYNGSLPYTYWVLVK